MSCYFWPFFDPSPVTKCHTSLNLVPITSHQSHDNILQLLNNNKLIYTLIFIYTPFDYISVKNANVTNWKMHYLFLLWYQETVKVNWHWNLIIKNCNNLHFSHEKEQIARMTTIICVMSHLLRPPPSPSHKLSHRAESLFPPPRVWHTLWTAT